MDYYLGEIRLFPYDKIPKDWVMCNGQTMTIQQSPALYSLLGNIYGGTTNVNFCLTNLNGTVIVGQGRSTTGTIYQLGKKNGAESVVLTAATIPGHNHWVHAATTYDSSNATGELLGNPNIPTSSTQTSKNTGTTNIYAAVPSPNVSLNPLSITTTGSNAAHENRMPYLAMCYCISLTGLWPSRPD